MTDKDSSLLRWIAAFKFLKAAALIATGIGVFKMMHSDVGNILQQWVHTLRLNPGNRFVERALHTATNLSPERIKDLGLVSFVYAGLFLVEGTGLWLKKRWGEWVTAIITGSLVPLEMYEAYRQFTALKAIVLAINMAVVVYLVVRIRRESRKDH